VNERALRPRHRERAKDRESFSLQGIELIGVRMLGRIFCSRPTPCATDASSSAVGRIWPLYSRSFGGGFAVEGEIEEAEEDDLSQPRSRYALCQALGIARASCVAR